MKLMKLLLRVLRPRSFDEDTRRQEFILNIFTASILFLLVSAIAASSLNYFFFSDSVSWENSALSFGVLFGITAFFASILVLSRRGFVHSASHLLLSALFFLATYLGYLWGVDVVASILFYVITVVMAGILISTRYAFIVTMVIGTAIGVISHMQRMGIVEANRYWTTEPWRITDVVVATILFLIIATVSWLSNREIERALTRARKSERALKEERDMLEVRVEERTSELRKAEMEKIAQAYRFVEFGRLASGLFHDLMNPLTALSLNIERIAHSGPGKGGGKLETLGEDIERAKRASVHMQNLMDAMRKHLSQEGVQSDFSLKERIEDIVRVLESYARMRQVTLTCIAPDDIVVYGDATRLVQVVSNLISNAIESYVPQKQSANERREVLVELMKKDGNVYVLVRDFGSGISGDIRGQIFEPFFTTKESRGLGLGLSFAKRIVEREFGGTILVESEEGEGSHFAICFPLKKS